MKNTFLPAFFLCLLSGQMLMAQTYPACSVPLPPGAESCWESCVYCNLDGFMGINDGTPGLASTPCGSIAIHNDQWFGFTAGSDSITISVTASNCQNGDGLQIALFGDCSDPDALACNSGTPGGAGSPLLLEYNNFMVGETYFLLVDGWSGDVCNYEIDISDGSINAPLPDNAGQPQGPILVCPGAVMEYRIDTVPGAGYYHWTVPPTATINGLSNNETIEGPSGTTVTVTFGASGGNICVQAGNACHPPSAQACLVVNNQAIPPTILPNLTVCLEDVPFVWTEEPYPTLNSPGVFQLTSAPYPSVLGCDSLVRQTIIIKSNIASNLGTRVICQGDCFMVGGTALCNPGVYTEILNSYQGCDSAVTVQIMVLDPASSATIQAPLGQVVTCAQPSLVLLSQNLPGVSHLWKNHAGDTLGTSSFITVQTAGFYSHEVKTTQGGTNCVSLAKILIKQNNFPPPVSATGGTLDAAHPTVQLIGNSIISGLTYHWTGPNGFTSSLKKPIVSVPGSYTLTVTDPQTGCSNSITVEVLMMS